MEHTENQPIIDAQTHDNRLKSYVAGFVLSLIFTLIPFFLVTSFSLNPGLLIGILISFAVAQLIVQLVFFLHMGKSSKKEWNLIALIFTVIVVLIVVIGTIWVMNNLNYNMHPTQAEEYLKRQEGF